MNANSGFTNNNNINNTPRKPSKAQIQRQEIQRDIDKQDAKDANRDNGVNVIGSHNYSYASQTPNQKTFLAKLRRKLKPWIKKWRQFRYRLEESARKRKRIIFLSFIGIALLTCVWGHFDKPGIMVDNTAMGTKRTFVNADTIKMTGVKYDRNNESLQANFVTSSQSGEISPKDLVAHFVLAGGPKHNGVRRPTLNLVPTFNNHFTVIVHHLYPGFGGIALQFHDKSDITASSLANSDDTQVDRLPDADNSAIQKLAQNGASYKESKRAYRALRKLRRKNDSNFVIGEVKARQKYSGYINPFISPRHLAIHDLRITMKHEYSRIHGDTIMMNHEKTLFKQDQNKIRQINRGADTGQKNNELQSTRTQAQQTLAAISNYKNHIKTLHQNANTNFSRITRLKDDVSVMPKTQSPKPGKLFTNAAH